MYATCVCTNLSCLKEYARFDPLDAPHDPKPRGRVTIQELFQCQVPQP